MMDAVRSFLDSTDLMGSGPALAARLRHDGYLFLRGLLPREAVLEVRLRLLEKAAGPGAGSIPSIPSRTASPTPRRACKDPEERYMRVFRGIWGRRGAAPAEDASERADALRRGSSASRRWRIRCSSSATSSRRARASISPPVSIRTRSTSAAPPATRCGCRSATARGRRERWRWRPAPTAQACWTPGSATGPGAWTSVCRSPANGSAAPSRRAMC